MLVRRLKLSTIWSFRCWSCLPRNGSVPAGHKLSSGIALRFRMPWCRRPNSSRSNTLWLSSSSPRTLFGCSSLLSYTYPRRCIFCARFAGRQCPTGTGGRRASADFCSESPCSYKCRPWRFRRPTFHTGVIILLKKLSHQKIQKWRNRIYEVFSRFKSF